MCRIHPAKFQLKHWGTHTFYALLAFVAIVLFSKFISDKAKVVFLNQFHLKQSSFPLFAAAHFIPPMYNFANEFWYSHQLIDFAQMENNTMPAKNVMHFWVNHYPLRIITFNLLRSFYFTQKDSQYIYVRSRFMNLTLRSIYRLQNNGSTLEIIPVESFAEGVKYDVHD